MSVADNVIRKNSPIVKQTFFRLVIDASGEPVADQSQQSAIPANTDGNRLGIKMKQ